MSSWTRTKAAGCALLIAGLAGVILLRWRVERRQGGEVARGMAAVTQATHSPEALFFSGDLLRHMSLGFEGLLADIYWTRVVQYFGRKKLDAATRFDLLGPLLRVTTTLDPHLVIAYRYGAIFLAEKPPGGAGEPEEALALLRRGIVANPQYWRFWQDLGFIYYWDLKDYRHAAQAFEAGASRPGALPWMKVLAAMVVAKGGELRTSQLLWAEVYRNAGNDQLRRSAQEHLAALEAEQQMQRLNELASRFAKGAGRPPRSLADLVAAGLLPASPKDPSGAPYVMDAEGRVHLGPATRVDLHLLQ
jgi:hypothetical protein